MVWRHRTEIIRGQLHELPEHQIIVLCTLFWIIITNTNWSNQVYVWLITHAFYGWPLCIRGWYRLFLKQNCMNKISLEKVSTRKSMLWRSNGHGFYIFSWSSSCIRSERVVVILWFWEFRLLVVIFC